MLLLTLLIGCTQPEPELLADGVCQAQLSAQARVSERVRYALTYPCEDVDTPDTSVTMLAGFVQGGFVAPDRYGWMEEHLASNGWVVVRPKHPADLAIDAADNTTIAAEDLRWRSGREGLLQDLLSEQQHTAIMGHSLGGVVAAMQWTAHPQDWEGLFIIASYPAEGTDVGSRQGPVLSLMGDTEEQSHLQTFEASQARFQGPTLWGRVQGMNHFAWTDDPNPDELAGDGPLERDLEEIRADVLGVMDTWLAGELLGDAAALEQLEDPDFPGVEVLP